MHFEQQGHKLNLTLTRGDAYKMIEQLTRSLVDQEQHMPGTSVLSLREPCPYLAQGRDYPGQFVVVIEPAAANSK